MMRGIGKTMFEDRIDAANQLVEKLLSLRDADEQLGKHFENSNPIVILAVPRGGVIIGDVIASRLGAKLDLVVTRKIGAPDNPEFAIGSVMPDGTCFLNMDVIEAFHIPQEYISAQASKELDEINRRLVLYRGRRGYDNELEGKIVVLVDDGIATGSTIYAAAQWVKGQKCKKLIIGIPVGPDDTLEKIKEVADMVVYIKAATSFDSVGQFYQHFDQVTDGEVMSIMRKHGYKIRGGSSYSENAAAS